MSAPSPLVAPSLGQSNSDRKKQAVDKGKNLVLCFDGTANEYTDTNTHIVKLFTFLEKVRSSPPSLTINIDRAYFRSIGLLQDSPEQLCYYQVHSLSNALRGHTEYNIQTGVGTYIGTGFIGPITKRIAKVP